MDKKLIVRIVEAFIICFGAEAFFDKGTRSVLPVAISIAWVVARNKMDAINMSKAEKIATGILSGCFSLAVELVEAEKIRERLDGLESVFSVVMLFVALLLMFYTLTTYVWNYVRDLAVTSNGLEIKNKKKAYWIITGIIFGLLFIGLLFEWPGDLSKDSVGIINQALYENKMNAGFTFLIIWLMRLCCSLATAMGAKISFGIGLYNLIQIVFVSLIEGYIVYSLAVKGVNRYFIYLSVLFFGIMPYNVHLSHTVWKDIPFTVWCVLLMFLISEESVEKRPAVNKEYWIRLCMIAVSAVGTCIYRTNGYYAFILSLPFLLIVFWKKRKDMCVTFIVAFVLVSVIQGPLTDAVVNSHNKRFIETHSFENEDALAKVKTDNSNMMGEYGATGLHIVTIQQIAAVAYNRSDLTTEDKQLIAEVLDVEKLGDKYNPGISDNTLRARVKCNTKRYLQVWLKLGMRYPSTYVAAWKNMTYGYWYPDMEERWVYAETYPYNEFGIERVEVLPHFMYEAKSHVDRLYKRIPFYGLLWSIGFVVWVTAFAVAFTIVKKGWKKAICYMPIVGVWLSLLIATPVYGEFRYLYPFFMALPIILAVPYIERKDK